MHKIKFKIYRKCQKIMRFFLNNTVRHLKPSKKILYNSFYGSRFSGNPRAIFEAIMEEDGVLANEYQHVIYLNDVDEKFKKYIDEFDKKIKIINSSSIFGMYYVTRSKIIIANIQFNVHLKKPKKQVYIQTWHGTPLKNIGLLMEEILFSVYKDDKQKYYDRVKMRSAKWNFLISPNRYSTDRLSKAFDVPVSRIKEIGYPRNTELYHYSDEDVPKIKQKLGIDNNKKVILYTPTFLDNVTFPNGSRKSAVNTEIIDELKKEYNVLLREHYFVKKENQLSDNEIINVSNYHNINDLFIISDVLVCDISSTMFDYMNLRRPIYIDMPEHLNLERGYDHEMMNLINELPRALEGINTEEHSTKAINKILDFMQVDDRNSKEKIVELIYEEL